MGPLLKKETKEGQGKGTDDHLMPLGYLLGIQMIFGKICKNQKVAIEAASPSPSLNVLHASFIEERSNTPSYARFHNQKENSTRNEFNKNKQIATNLVTALDHVTLEIRHEPCFSRLVGRPVTVYFFHRKVV